MNCASFRLGHVIQDSIIGRGTTLTHMMLSTIILAGRIRIMNVEIDSLREKDSMVALALILSSFYAML